VGLASAVATDKQMIDGVTETGDAYVVILKYWPKVDMSGRYRRKRSRCMVSVLKASLSA